MSLYPVHPLSKNERMVLHKIIPALFYFRQPTILAPTREMS